MNNSTLIIVFIILAIIFCYLPLKQVRQAQLIRRRKIRKTARKERNSMNELLQSYLGKDCAIYMGSMNGVTGTITRIVDNWIEVNYKGQTKIINADYISQIDIREPKMK